MPSSITEISIIYILTTIDFLSQAMLRLATLRLLTSCKMIRYKLNSTLGMGYFNFVEYFQNLICIYSEICLFFILAHRHLLGKKLVPLEIAGINSFSYSSNTF